MSAGLIYRFGSRQRISFCLSVIVLYADNCILYYIDVGLLGNIKSGAACDVNG
jgi:hypothetical protein